jgi:2-keto-4-pentenoate hydratase/2-oxohepta-3-ene-1,7-dioic acid hydratase in catechol pathway
VRQAAAEEPVFGDRDEWSVERARHFYTSFGNHGRAEADEGLATLTVPRFFTGPARSLGAGGSRIEIPPRATDLLVSVELAVIVGRLAAEVDATDAERVIFGVTPLISVCDLSFEQAVVEPARLGERHIPAVYGRWADGFNVVLDRPPAWRGDWRDLGMTLDVDGDQVTGSTSDYIAGPGELIETISAMTTLFPGDVITLGSTHARIRVPSGEPVRVVGRIDGIGEVFAELAPARHH